jgi:hypothetical protein
LDPWCQQYNYYDHLISCFLLWCLFNSHGPKTLWLLLTPSQGYGFAIMLYYHPAGLSRIIMIHIIAISLLDPFCRISVYNQSLLDPRHGLFCEPLVLYSPFLIIISYLSSVCFPLSILMLLVVCVNLWFESNNTLLIYYSHICLSLLPQACTLGCCDYLIATHCYPVMSLSHGMSSHI